MNARRSMSLVGSLLVLGSVAVGCAHRSTTTSGGGTSCTKRTSDARSYWAQAAVLQQAGRIQTARAMETAAGDLRSQAAMTSTAAAYLERGNTREQARQLDMRADELRQGPLQDRSEACR